MEAFVQISGPGRLSLVLLLEVREPSRLGLDIGLYDIHLVLYFLGLDFLGDFLSRTLNLIHIGLYEHILLDDLRLGDGGVLPRGSHSSYLRTSLSQHIMIRGKDVDFVISGSHFGFRSLVVFANSVDGHIWVLLFDSQVLFLGDDFRVLSIAQGNGRVGD